MCMFDFVNVCLADLFDVACVILIVKGIAAVVIVLFARRDVNNLPKRQQKQQEITSTNNCKMLKRKTRFCVCPMRKATATATATFTLTANFRGVVLVVVVVSVSVVVAVIVAGAVSVLTALSFDLPHCCCITCTHPKRFHLTQKTLHFTRVHTSARTISHTRILSFSCCFCLSRLA